MLLSSLRKQNSCMCHRLQARTTKLRFILLGRRLLDWRLRRQGTGQGMRPVRSSPRAAGASPRLRGGRSPNPARRGRRVSCILCCSQRLYEACGLQ